MNFEIALERMPHRGAMQLIESVSDANANQILCIAKPHQPPEYPLRVDGVLHATALVELGAQAAAAHASLFGVGAAHVGLLLSLSNVEIGDLAPDEIKGSLQIRAVRQFGDAGSARYHFDVVTKDADMVLSGDAVLSMVASA